jgi:hypothetical protein
MAHQGYHYRKYPHISIGNQTLKNVMFFTMIMDWIIPTIWIVAMIAVWVVCCAISVGRCIESASE